MNDEANIHPVAHNTSNKRGFVLSLKGRALRYLATREHSRMELERKLKPHAESIEQLVRVLDELTAKDFISEARVVESIVNRRAAKFGAARVKHELMSKGLGAELIAEAMSRLWATEVERAREIWRRKFGSAAPDAGARVKQMRFLAARGFSGDTIRKVVANSDED